MSGQAIQPDRDQSSPPAAYHYPDPHGDAAQLVAPAVHSVLQERDGLFLWLKFKMILAWLKQAVTALLIAGSLYIGVAPAPPAHAANYTAGTYAELVSALNSANASPEDDTITLTGNITLTDNLPLIKSNIVFEGNNHFVSGNDQYRVFFVGGGDPQTVPTVTFRNLTIQHGKAQGGNGGAGLGGGMFVYDGDVKCLYFIIHCNL